MTVPYEIYPETTIEWRNWLIDHYSTTKSIWVIFPKKASGLQGITPDEAIDEALCFGWIDSIPNKVDDSRFKVLFSPRNPKSNWSRVNKARVARLEKEGRIAKPGYDMIRIAKETGTWIALDDVENLVIPDDLETELKTYKDALPNFEAFPRSAKRGILEWIFNAKREETRKKRIKETARLAEDNIRANQYR